MFRLIPRHNFADSCESSYIAVAIAIATGGFTDCVTLYISVCIAMHSVLTCINILYMRPMCEMFKNVGLHGVVLKHRGNFTIIFA
jgi:hypothetical protein